MIRYSVYDVMRTELKILAKSTLPNTGKMLHKLWQVGGERAKFVHLMPTIVS